MPWLPPNYLLGMLAAHINPWGQHWSRREKSRERSIRRGRGKKRLRSSSRGYLLPHFLYCVTNFAKMKASESSSRTSSGTLFAKRGGTCRSACPGRFVHNTRQRMFRCSTFGGKKSAGEIRVARDSGPRPLRIEVGEKGFDLEIIRIT